MAPYWMSFSLRILADSSNSSLSIHEGISQCSLGINSRGEIRLGRVKCAVNTHHSYIVLSSLRSFVSWTPRWTVRHWRRSMDNWTYDSTSAPGLALLVPFLPPLHSSPRTRELHLFSLYLPHPIHIPRRPYVISLLVLQWLDHMLVTICDVDESLIAYDLSLDLCPCLPAYLQVLWDTFLDQRSGIKRRPITQWLWVLELELVVLSPYCDKLCSPQSLPTFFWVFPLMRPQPSQPVCQGGLRRSSAFSASGRILFQWAICFQFKFWNLKNIISKYYREISRLH